MSKHKGSGGHRGVWRQQQAAAALLQRALHAPTLCNRVHLLQQQLAPLFLFLNSQTLAAEGIDVPDTVPEQAVEAAVQQVQSCLTLDEQTGITRVLVHALLFAALDIVQDHTQVPKDEFDIESTWRLSTGLYATLVTRLCWEDLAQSAIAWVDNAGLQAALVDRLSVAVAAPWPSLLAVLLSSQEPQGRGVKVFNQHELAPVVLQRLQQHAEDVPASQQSACIATLARFLCCAAASSTLSADPAATDATASLAQAATLALQELLTHVSGSINCVQTAAAAAMPAQATPSHASVHLKGQPGTADPPSSTVGDNGRNPYSLASSSPAAQPVAPAAAADSGEVHHVLAELADFLDRQLQTDMAALTAGHALDPGRQERFQANCHLKARISMVQTAQKRGTQPEGSGQSPVGQASASGSLTLVTAVCEDHAGMAASHATPAKTPGREAYSFAGLGRAAYADTWSRALSLAPDWGDHGMPAAAPAGVLSMQSMRSTLAEVLAGQALVQALSMQPLAGPGCSTASDAILAGEPGTTRSQAISSVASTASGLNATSTAKGSAGDAAKLASEEDIALLQQMLGCSIHTPLHMALAFLSMLCQVSRAAPAGSTHAAAAVRTNQLVVLCQLCANAIGSITDSTQQRLLLRLALLEPQMAAVREALRAHAALQSAVALDLVAVSNHMISVAEADSYVFGAEPARVAAAVQELLPFAVLAPEATLRRVITDGSRHSGQGSLVVEVLLEMPALARYQPTGASHPLVVSLLADVLTCPSVRSAAAELAFLRFVKGLAAAPAAGQQDGRASESGQGQGPSALLAEEVLQALVIPQLAAAADIIVPGQLPAGSSATPASAQASASMGLASTAAAQPRSARGANALNVLNVRNRLGQEQERHLSLALKLGLQTLEAAGQPGRLLSRAGAERMLPALCLLVDKPSGARLAPLSHALRSKALQLTETCISALASYHADVAYTSERGQLTIAGDLRLLQQLREISAPCQHLGWPTRLLLLPLLATQHAPLTGPTDHAANQRGRHERLPDTLCPPCFSQFSMEPVDRLLTHGQAGSAQAAAELALSGKQLQAAVADALAFAASHGAHAQAFAAACCQIVSPEQHAQPIPRQHDQRSGQASMASSAMHASDSKLECLDTWQHWSGQLAASLAVLVTSVDAAVLREALLIGIAEAMPDWTQRQYIRVLHTALLSLVRVLLRMLRAPPSAVLPQPADEKDSVQLVMLQGVVAGVATRAIYLLALAPHPAFPPGSETIGPSVARQTAVQSALQYLLALCMHALSDVEAQHGQHAQRHLSQRYLAEVAGLVRRLQDTYDCGALQTLVLHLLKVTVEGTVHADAASVAWIRRQLDAMDEPLHTTAVFALEKLLKAR